MVGWLVDVPTCAVMKTAGALQPSKNSSRTPYPTVAWPRREEGRKEGKVKV